jgi:hypothetical protein
MVVGIEVRTAPVTMESWVRSYGVIDGGFETMGAAWPKLEHRFSVRRNKDKFSGEAREPEQVHYGQHRLPTNLLEKWPVDMLIVEQGHCTQPPLTYQPSSWETVMDATRPVHRPRVVIETWPSNSQMWSKGPTCKSTITQWQELGYVSRFHRIANTQVGGAIY